MKIITVLGILLLFLLETFGKNDWWKTMSLYQIYPSSFKDSDGDGVGDLQGIHSKLQYLKDSKFDAFWITPMFRSPMVDFGYDISDYRDVDPSFGTMEDMESLIQAAHNMSIKVLLDFVPNHSSDQHEWFKKSVQKIEPYTDYYVWSEGKIVNGTRHPPNNWISLFHNSAWTWNEERQAYYYHNFKKEQPDLNLRNMAVREELKSILRFWLDKGIDGFRVDAPANFFEDQQLRDEPLSGITHDPKNYSHLIHEHTVHAKENYEVVTEWRAVLDEYDSRVLLMEIYADVTTVMNYYKAGAHFPFNYEFIDRISNKSTATDFKNIIDIWMNNMPAGAVANWGTGNHDRPRLFSRLGTDIGAAILLMTHILPGVAVTYYGDEIGMTDFKLTYEETRDPQALELGPNHFEDFPRDPSRTPFQWDDSTSAGFSSNSTPWLPVNDNFHTINLLAEKKDKNSFYNLFLKVTKMRSWRAVEYGTLNLKMVEKNVLVISRILENEKSVFMIINFEKNSQCINFNSFKQVSDNLKLYVSTKNFGIKVGERLRSNFGCIPSRSAAIFITDNK